MRRGDRRQRVREWLVRLWSTVRASRTDADLEEEVRFHAELAGETGLVHTMEAMRDQRELPLLGDLGRDVRYAIRTLRKSPSFTLVAVLTLALGIGANAAMFSIVNSLLLRALPVERPDRLVLLLSNASNPNVNVASPWSNPLWEQIRDRHTDLFQSAFAFSRRITRFDFAHGGPTDFVDGIFASGAYFQALGVKPVLGRTFGPDDDRRGGGADGPVAVISYRFWQRRFGGAPDVVGRTQTIDRVAFTIVGVTPPEFFGTDVGSQSDVIIPIGTEPLLRGRDSALDRPTTSWLLIMARLKDEQSVAGADLALRTVQPGIREATTPTDAPAGTLARYLAAPFGVAPASSGTSAMRGRYRQPLLTIMVVVALVLVVACANIANLFLARAAARRHEFSVHRALGASRWRLARRQLVESLLLSAAGAVLGLALARWASVLLVRQLSTQANTVFLDTRLDWRVLAFTTAVAVAVALLFGVAPTLRASHTSPIDALREQGRGATERPSGVAGSLVAGQVALSLVLIVAAGLFIRTFNVLAGMDVGFDRDRVLLVRLDVPRTDGDLSQRTALYEQIAASVRATPGVERAAMSEITPVSGMITDTYVEVEGGPPFTPSPQHVSYENVITPEWFATYGTRLLAGRDFDNRDRAASPEVAIVNETFVRKFLAGRDPIGRRIRNASPRQSRPWIEVVGVVQDANYLTLRERVPATMYVPLAQKPVSGAFTFVTLSVRASSHEPASLTRAVGDAIARVDPAIAITFATLKQQLDAALVQERVVALLSGSFGGFALLLCSVGLYGVTAYSVNRRRTEIGIRIAIGAAPAQVIRLVLARVAVLIGIGVVTGVGASVWASRFVAALLYGLEPRDPITLASSAAVLALVGALAGWLPAYRASRIDPAEVLRQS
jgi:putative ABC transport system permease protein